VTETIFILAECLIIVGALLIGIGLYYWQEERRVR
jgi:hypothetical protein